MEKVDYEKFYTEVAKVKVYAEDAQYLRGKSQLRAFCPFCKKAGFIINLINGSWKCNYCEEGTFEDLCHRLEVKMPVDKPVDKLPVVKAEKPKPKKDEPAVKDLKGQIIFAEKPNNYQKKQEKKGKKGTFEKAYDYKDETGKLKHQTVRYKNPKSFSQRRPYDKTLDDKLGNVVKGQNIFNKKGKWIGKLPWVNSLIGITPVLYRLIELIKSKGQILLPEGEKDCDNLAKRGYTATTCPMGALKWKKSYNQYLVGRDIVLIPDYDPKEKLVGDEHVKRIGNSLIGIARTIKVLKPKDAKGKRLADMSVYLAGSPDPKELDKLIKEAPDFEPTELPFIPEPKAKRQAFNPRPYSNEILKQYKLLFDEKKRFWYYHQRAGIWKQGFDLLLNEKLRKKVLDLEDLTNKAVREILKDLEGLCLVPTEPNEPPPYTEPEAHLIPFNNVIYDLKAEKTLAYKPEYFFINKLKANYNPKAGTYPNIQTFFENIVRREDVITLKEIIAYCYYRGYPYAKSYWLYGGGSNGKSKYAEVVKKIIGDQNVATVSLERIQKNIFATSELYGKLINLSPELSKNVLRNTDLLRALTGTDSVDAQKKFQHAFSFVNYAKLIFTANEIPFSTDKSYAFYRRIFLVEFPNRFETAIKADPRIIDKIPEKEFEALAFDCLELMRDLYSEKRKFVFARHKYVKEVTEIYEKLSDPLQVFLDEKTKDDPAGDIPVRNFNNEYKKWLKKKGLRLWTDKQISSVMNSKGITKRSVTISKGLARKDYHTYKAYLELSWKKATAESEKNSQDESW